MRPLLFVIFVICLAYSPMILWSVKTVNNLQDFRYISFFLYRCLCALRHCANYRIQVLPAQYSI